jgi:hypothetical protein
MPTRKFKNAALRYTRLAEQATTVSVRTHLLRLAQHYEALIVLPETACAASTRSPSPRGERDGERGSLHR